MFILSYFKRMTYICKAHRKTVDTMCGDSFPLKSNFWVCTLPKSSNVSSTVSSKVSNRQPTIGACIFKIEFLSKARLLISTLKMYLILSLSYSVQTRISFKIYHGTDTYRHFFWGGYVCLWVIKKDVCKTCLDICNTCLSLSLSA